MTNIETILEEFDSDGWNNESDIWMTREKIRDLVIETVKQSEVNTKAKEVITKLIKEL